jgi:hypothetical protein
MTRKIKLIAYVVLCDGFQTYIFWEGQLDPQRYKFLSQEELNEAMALCGEQNIVIKDMTKSVQSIGMFMNRTVRKR